MNELFQLSGKRALVTGSSSGLGAYFASVLAAAGAEVVLAARRAEALGAVAGRLRAEGLKVATLVLDVTDSQSHNELIATCGRLDIR